MQTLSMIQTIHIFTHIFLGFSLLTAYTKLLLVNLRFFKTIRIQILQQQHQCSLSQKSRWY